MTNMPNYAEDHRFDALSTNGHERQWSIDENIDWSQNIIRPNWLMRRFHGALISQFYHGELATVQICRRLLDEIDDPSMQYLLHLQIVDEQRHADVFERYLARLGDRASIDPSMAEVMDRTFQWQGSPLGLMVAVHILLEGEALRTLQDLAQEMPCPLFRQINTLIMHDEARHIAFGKIYLSQQLRRLDLDERMAIYQFVKSLWDDCTSGILSQFKIPGFVTQGLRRRWVSDGWGRHNRSLVDIGLVGKDGLACD